MELFKEILKKVLEDEEIHVVFPNLKISTNEIVEMQCYRALQKIKEIIESDKFSDKECFMQIEGIVCVLEDIGSNGADRHEFS